MKRKLLCTVSALLVLVMLFSLSACELFGQGENPDKGSDELFGQDENPGEGSEEQEGGVWKDALYLEDTTLGTGNKTVTLEVKAEDKSVIFTVLTDADTVGDALIEHGLIAGEEGAYGLYVKVVNGITADYDVNQCYWAFYTDGSYAMSGVDTTSIEEGVSYKLEYTKG